MSKPRLQLYYREGCHLCEEMAAVLYRGWPQLLDELEWVDIDRSPQLTERYGALIPVLMMDGSELCHFQANRERLSAVFGEPANPV